ncbi:hypothetical protein TWF694_008321 [Orbilia ellipsospora]|uniref:Uncharacterized protein n=1 Tax=Orbilia ellipsospora TaxID=2528407 RepID=A0AAV9XFR1_9PEZI
MKGGFKLCVHESGDIDNESRYNMAATGTEKEKHLIRTKREMKKNVSYMMRI